MADSWQPVAVAAAAAVVVVVVVVVVEPSWQSDVFAVLYISSYMCIYIYNMFCQSCHQVRFNVHTFSLT